MRLLLTRPAEDGAALAAALASRGHAAVLCPLLRIELLPPAELPAHVEAVAVTSKNALRALAAGGASAAARLLPLYCVGPGAAELAATLGFHDIRSGGGTAAALAEDIAHRERRGAAMLYLRGEDVSFDLEAALRARGIEAESRIAYRAVAADAMPAEVAEALAAGAVDGVILMSPRTARVYARLVAPAAARTPCYCLSDAVARFAPGPALVASAPNEAALLELIEAEGSQKKTRRIDNR